MNSRIHGLDDYQKLRESFHWECPEYFNFATDVVDKLARSQPDKTAILCAGSDHQREITFGEITTRSSQLGRGLSALGLIPGERVLVLLPRVVEWWESLLGLCKAGLVAMPGTSLLTASDIAYRVETADAVAVITDAEGARKLQEVAASLPGLRIKIVTESPPNDDWIAFEQLLTHGGSASDAVTTRSDDPALLYFTSGTTGMPKMVMHTHASYGLGHQVTGRYWLDLDENDLHWNISDTGWAKAAWSSLFGPWTCGASLFLQTGTARFRPDDVLQLLADYPITTMCAAPTIYRMLIQQELRHFQPQALRHCVAAGEPLNPEVIGKWRDATGITVRDGYGQTETVLLCGNFPGIDVKPGSMGLPTPGFDLAVIDYEGNRLPAGQEGDIAVRVEPQRPLGLFQQYWRSAEATRAAFQHGWYITGDRALVDEDGYFWFVGRADDVITSSAYRIGPFEVESALISHAAVAEAAVVGKPDPLRGQIVKAFIVLAEGFEGSDALRAELQAHVKGITAPYKYPREIQFMRQLPKTVSGKIRRAELRKM